MATLLHLNGPPGIGKSTLARRWAADRPGTLVCDVDLLRTMVSGWREDFVGVGALVRPAALAMIGAYLGGGQDVVLPQLLADPAELARFEGAAHAAGARFVTVLLTDDEDASVARFARRGADEQDPWHGQVRRIVAEQGGEQLLRDYVRRLRALSDARPDVVVVPSVEGDLEATYLALVAATARAGQA